MNKKVCQYYTSLNAPIRQNPITIDIVMGFCQMVYTPGLVIASCTSSAESASSAESTKASAASTSPVSATAPVS